MDSIDPQVTGRRFGGSFTIAEWCKYRRLSISMYYKLRARGKAPVTLPVGRHQTITVESDAAWARERQAEGIVLPVECAHGALPPKPSQND